MGEEYRKKLRKSDIDAGGYGSHKRPHLIMSHDFGKEIWSREYRSKDVKPDGYVFYNNVGAGERGNN